MFSWANRQARTRTAGKMAGLLKRITASHYASRTPAPRPPVEVNALARVTGQRSAFTKISTDINVKFMLGAQIKRETDPPVAVRSIARDKDKELNDPKLHMPPKPNVYKDNWLNRKLNRVGLPRGSAPYNAEIGRITVGTYVDSRNLNCVGIQGGSVLVTNKRTKTVGIPIIVNKIFNSDQVESFSRNRDIRKPICCKTNPNIVRYSGFCDESPNICIVMEYWI